MKPALVVNNDKGIILDHKARLALIEAVRFQLQNWQSRRAEEMDEDDFADLQNDIGYLGALLTHLEEEHARLGAATR